MINPNVVEGQIDGGTVQGIGGALYEHLAYDEDGNPVATTFVDYLIPTIAEVPVIEHGHIETPGPGPAATRASARAAPSARHRPSSTPSPTRSRRSASPSPASRSPRRRSSGCSTKRRRATIDADRAERRRRRRRTRSSSRRSRPRRTASRSLWYASGRAGRSRWSPWRLAGRATSTIELGTAVLQTYPCHPLLQARAGRVGRRRRWAGRASRSGGPVARVDHQRHLRPAPTTTRAATPRSTCRSSPRRCLREVEHVELREARTWTVRTRGGRSHRRPRPGAPLRAVAPAARASPASTPTATVLLDGDRGGDRTDRTSPPGSRQPPTAAGRPAPHGIVAGLPVGRARRSRTHGAADGRGRPR